MAINGTAPFARMVATTHSPEQKWVTTMCFGKNYLFPNPYCWHFVIAERGTASMRQRHETENDVRVLERSKRSSCESERRGEKRGGTQLNRVERKNQ